MNTGQKLEKKDVSSSEPLAKPAEPRLYYCTKCLEPSSRPGAEFDENGVCLPCRYIENTGIVDWEARRRELNEIAAWGRQHQAGGYDCIVGVSGGKDSTRQAFYVRDELGLKPLLVCCSYPPEQLANRGPDNLSNLIEHGFDLHFVGPAPQSWKQMMRMGFLEFAQWTRSTELALYSTMPRVATAFNIPLIFLGENPALTFGAQSGSLNGDANNMRHYDTLAGAKIDPWLARGIERKNLFWYTFPADEEIERAQIRIVYLGYYIRDFNDTANAKFALDRGFIARTGLDADPSETGSLNPFESVDEDFVHVNQFLKQIKLGFGKVTQQVSVKVRNKEITREEGLQLIQKYDGECSERLITKFCDYLGIDRECFDEVTDNLRNRDLWQLNNHGEWELRFKPE